eukprot:3950812-Pleurochrysis_carterae.AAC.1
MCYYYNYTQRQRHSLVIPTENAGSIQKISSSQNIARHRIVWCLKLYIQPRTPSQKGALSRAGPSFSLVVSINICMLSPNGYSEELN